MISVMISRCKVEQRSLSRAKRDTGIGAEDAVGVSAI